MRIILLAGIIENMVFYSRSTAIAKEAKHLELIVASEE